MLFTRCPACETTFRITPEALRKADGQVRCGRCAQVFDAYADLRRRDAHGTGADEVAVTAAGASDDGDVAASSGLDEAPSGMSVAKILEQLESSGVEDEQATGAADVDEHGAARDEAETPPTPEWTFVEEPAASRRAARRWTVGCALMLVMLALQITHHFRAQIAAAEHVGPWLTDAYALLGARIEPQWRLEDYRIVDWTAVAEPRADGQGSLHIAAQIRNESPRAQPYPHVQVQLKDRWEDTVGSRVFEPAEYLSDESLAHGAMPSGHTASAELDIVDPGPDAYGFELDVCVAADADTLRCAADTVFR